MKTLLAFLSVAAASGFIATTVIAGPSGQILPIPPGSALREYTPPPVAQECKFMPSLVKSGTNTQLYEKCSPELMRTDARCRAHCGKQILKE